MEHLFDFLYKPDPDAWKWRLATGAAGAGAVLGFVLIARADASLGGIVSGAAGFALLLGSVLGFGYYWRNL